MKSHLERFYIEQQCRSSSDSETDSAVIRNTDGSQNVESDHWDFEETIWDKICDGNAFGGIVGPNRFEPCVSDSDEEGGSVREDENARHMITSARWSFVFCSMNDL